MLNVTYYLGLCYKSKDQPLFLIINFINQIKKIMKNLIIILSFIFASSKSFGQFVESGKFYELSKLWNKDSVSVKQLLNTYKLDISKLDTVQYFKQFKLSKKLEEDFSHNWYLYTLDKKTGVVTMDSEYTVGVCAKLNKYVMVVCFDLDIDINKKIICIKVF